MSNIDIRLSRWGKNVGEFEVEGVEEVYFRRGGVKVCMNDGKFGVCIGFEVEEFVGEIVRNRLNGMNRIAIIRRPIRNEILKSESDIGGGLNDGLNDL